MADRGRRRTLSEVLTLVHRTGPLSRAAITEATGLNRSTVSDLVQELAERALVHETEPQATNRVGRPSPTVKAHPRLVVLAVNPEVDAITTAWVGLSARVHGRSRHATRGTPSPDDLRDAVRRELRRGRSRAGARRVAGIGIAVPGLVRTADGVVVRAPHLGWADAPVRDELEAATGLPVAVGNDATLGATAEHLFGAGRGLDDLVYLNGGASGIGGGILAGGRLVTGHGGFAGEFGQTRPRIDEPATLEEVVSRARVLELLGETALTDDELEERLADAARPVGDELEHQTRMLGAALGGIVTVLDPQAVVLGGYLATLLRRDAIRGSTSLAELAAASAFRDSAERLRIVPAELGEDRLLVGAAEAAFAPLLADPAAMTASPETAEPEAAQSETA